MNEDVPFLKTKKHRELCKTWGPDDERQRLVEEMGEMARAFARIWEDLSKRRVLVKR